MTTMTMAAMTTTMATTTKTTMTATMATMSATMTATMTMTAMMRRSRPQPRPRSGAGARRGRRGRGGRGGRAAVLPLAAGDRGPSTPPGQRRLHDGSARHPSTCHSCASTIPAGSPPGRGVISGSCRAEAGSRSRAAPSPEPAAFGIVLDHPAWIRRMLRVSGGDAASRCGTGASCAPRSVPGPCGQPGPCGVGGHRRSMAAVACLARRRPWRRGSGAPPPP